MDQVIQRRKKIEANIDMTPLIDVVFQLLIFLLVSSQFVKPEKQVDLPSGASQGATITDKEKSTIFTITSDNEIEHDGQKISRNDIQSYIAGLVKNQPVRHLTLRADRGSFLGIFIETIEAAKELGIENISYHKKTSE